MPILRWPRLKAILIVAFFGVFVLTYPARADLIDTTAGILSAIAQVIISLVSQILVALIQILLAVTQYNDFINAPAVVKGWVLVRDVSNLAFLVIFITIAFATILGVEKYEYKRLLPKLLMMAVLINFSRTICGLILDAAQVVMMTFVNGFKDVAAGNLIRGFGLQDMLTLRDSKPGDPGVTPNTVAAASLLAVVMLIIATITVGVIVVMFLVRILYLWILVLLSPLAFMLSAAPGLSGKFDEWWGKFVKYAISGPIMAFFLWLSFSIMASVQPGSTLASESRIMPTDTASERVGATITKIGESDQLLSYGIAIALLLLSLSIASEMGVKGGRLAEAAIGRIRSGAGGLAKFVGVTALTGGLGTVGMYGAYKGGRAFAKTTAGKWTGRRMDEAITAPTTRALGRFGARIFGEETRIGKGARKLAERGVLLRTVKQSWKERAESREKNITAPYIGAGRDVLNQVIDSKDTNYVFRHVMALANEEAKKQREESDDTSEAFLEPLYKVFRSGNVQNTKETKGALINVWNKNDQNEITLSEQVFKREIDEATGQERDVTISEEINRRVVANFEKNLNDESKARANAYMAAKEKLADAVERGASKTELLSIGQEADVAKKALKPLEFEYAKHKQERAKDSSFARVEALKMLIGDSDEARQFAAKLSGLALENKNYAGFALAGHDSKTGKYNYQDLYSEDGFRTYNSAVMGKMRNIPPPDLFRGHPSSFRDEVIHKNGVRSYDDGLNTVGNSLMLLASALLSERNFAPRPDSSGGFIGGVAQREYPDLYNVDAEKREQARRDLSEDMLLGYNYSLRPYMSKNSFERAIQPFLQRSGIPEEDFELSPSQLLDRHMEKLAEEKEALEAANTALEQARAAGASQEEQDKLEAEVKKVRNNVERLKTQTVRFVENIDPENIDIPVSTIGRKAAGGRGAAVAVAEPADSEEDKGP